jgi:hypothetical protein
MYAITCLENASNFVVTLDFVSMKQFQIFTTEVEIFSYQHQFDGYKINRAPIDWLLRIIHFSNGNVYFPIYEDFLFPLSLTRFYRTLLWVTRGVSDKKHQIHTFRQTFFCGFRVAHHFRVFCIVFWVFGVFFCIFVPDVAFLKRLFIDQHKLEIGCFSYCAYGSKYRDYHLQCWGIEKWDQW